MQNGLVRALLPVALLLAAAPGPRTRSHGYQSHEGPTARVVFTGRVTDAATNVPLAHALVTLVGIPGPRATTDSGGRYRLDVADTLVRGRAITLAVHRIGYAPATRSIRVAGETVTADISLSAAMLQLNEVVVTGTATTMDRRAMGSAAVGVAVYRAHKSARGTNSVSAAAPGVPPNVRRRGEQWNTEAYDSIQENPFIAPSVSPRSTFSIDVDHASYSNVRRFLTGGQRPPRDAVRLEELINYFPYELAPPAGTHPVAISTEVAEAPWNPTHRLVRIGLRGKPIDAASLPPSNLVFLIDVSGSMQSEDKLPLLKSAFRLLVNQLRPQDRVALVVYAGSAGLVLPPTPGNEKERILHALDGLDAGGSTAGGAGLRLAYEVARQSYMREGNNRVILATDGDFNVGVSSDAEMVELIEKKREEGTFLTVLGFGTGNLKDAKMEKLANKGNGNYAYVDTPMEARKVLVTEMGATLLTVAKDVKLQIEFNPSRVAAYRLLGYENRLLRDEDFVDDTKDAGELGAGHSVTALYEIIPPDAPDAATVRRPDSLRYTRPAPRTEAARGGELLYVKLRYKRPDGRRSQELTHVVRDEAARSAPSTDLTFAAAVAEFGMLLRESPHKGAASMDSVIARAERGRGEDPFRYRAEFVQLARRARELLAGEAVAAEHEGRTPRDR